MHEHELHTQQAIFEEQYLMKKSPTLAIIDVVLSELNQRQEQGLLRKDLADKDKNRIAMKFIKLHDKVKNNQIVARTDTGYLKLSNKEK